MLEFFADILSDIDIIKGAYKNPTSVLEML